MQQRQTLCFLYVISCHISRICWKSSHVTGPWCNRIYHHDEGSKHLMWLTAWKPICNYRPALDIRLKEHLLPCIYHICRNINLNVSIVIMVTLDKMTFADLYKNTNTEPWSKTIKRRWLSWISHLYRLPENTPARQALAEFQRKTQRPSWATKTNVGGANPKRNRHKNSYTDNGQNRMESASAMAT